LNQIKLHSHQTVSEALMLMGNDKPSSLPIYEKGHVIGTLHYDDLIAFLDDGLQGDGIRAHKLHFDIKSATDAILTMKLKYYHAALQERNKKFPILQYTSAAAVLLVLAALAWLFFKPLVPENQNNQIIAGLNKAVLTLAGGKKIVLDEAKAGVMLTRNKLTYNDGTAVDLIPLHTVGMASVSTSRGGLYQVMLPDGTKVWLNAMSTIKFPQTFSSKEKRRVELEGEAYFEVAKVNYSTLQGIKQLPFIVVSKGQEIEVLGTHFNVNAYANEPATKTTLLEGLVRVTPANAWKEFRGADPSLSDPLELMSGVQGVVLKPGEESVLQGVEMIVNQVNAAEAIAWRKGDLIFRNASLESIMQVIARWYDVDVIYQANSHIKNELLGGAISKSSNMKDILKSLEFIGDVCFKVDGRQITVMQKPM
jgi:transmembrane sensor